MQKKRIVRFGKWLVKVAASYAAFIVIGMLLSLVPAGRLGLSEEQFFNFRMFFMLLGPIYLTLIVKIILTIIAAAKRRSKSPTNPESTPFAQGANSDLSKPSPTV